MKLVVIGLALIATIPSWAMSRKSNNLDMLVNSTYEQHSNQESKVLTRARKNKPQFDQIVDPNSAEQIVLVEVTTGDDEVLSYSKKRKVRRHFNLGESTATNF